MTEPGDSGAYGSVLIANDVLEVGLDSFRWPFLEWIHQIIEGPF